LQFNRDGRVGHEKGRILAIAHNREFCAGGSGEKRP